MAGDLFGDDNLAAARERIRTPPPAPAKEPKFNAWAPILGVREGLVAQPLASGAEIMGMFGEVLGASWDFSQNVPLHTSGTASGATTNAAGYALGIKTITLAADLVAAVHLLGHLAVLHEVEGRLQHGLLGDVVTVEVEVVLAVLLAHDRVAHDEAEALVELHDRRAHLEVLSSRHP